MQHLARRLASLLFIMTTVGCMDQGRHDQTLAEIEATRRDAAREGRLQALEREHAFLMQQVATMSASTHASLTQTSAKEEERDKRLAELSTQVAGVAQLISTWRDEERPTSLDPEARRVAEQGSEEERVAAVRKVQALIDAGRIKLLMRNGRIQLAQVRPIDTTNPYEPRILRPNPPPAIPPPAPVPVPVPRSPTKRPMDRLGF